MYHNSIVIFDLVVIFYDIHLILLYAIALLYRMRWKFLLTRISRLMFGIMVGFL